MFFSDPADHSYQGMEYPKGWMLNKEGVQRGSIWNLYETTSDALSIGYPSKEHYYRDKKIPEDFQYKIPSQPVSAESAAEIFKFMDDDTVDVPSSFKGSLNVKYRVQSSSRQTMTLKVNNRLEDKDSYVVCGTLIGKLPNTLWFMVYGFAVE